MTPAELAAIRERHTPPEVPPCPVCGGALTANPRSGIYTCPAGKAAYVAVDLEASSRARSGCEDIFPVGYDEAETHYEKSVWSLPDETKSQCPDVLTLCDALEAAHRFIARDLLGPHQSIYQERSGWACNHCAATGPTLDEIPHPPECLILRAAAACGRTPGEMLEFVRKVKSE